MSGHCRWLATSRLLWAAGGIPPDHRSWTRAGSVPPATPNAHVSNPSRAEAPVRRGLCRVPVAFAAMAERPTRFEHHRFVGDKRTQVVYDLDDPDLDQAVVDDLMASEQFTCFGPDSLPEARNRGYRLHRGQRSRIRKELAGG